MDLFSFEGGKFSKLKCSKCTEFMTAPISQCSKDHNICGACKQEVTICPLCQGVFVGQNNELEKLSEMTKFPCINVMFGCSEMMAGNMWGQHVRVCPCRLYECVVGKGGGCKWRGGRHVIVAHCEEKHKEVGWMNGCRIGVPVQNLKLTKEVWDFQMLQAYGELFWFLQHYSVADRKVYTAVQYVGPSEKAKTFMYKITYTSVTSPENVSMTCASHADSEDAEIILKSKNCAYIEFRKLLKLIHDCKVNFEVKVKKLK